MAIFKKCITSPGGWGNICNMYISLPITNWKIYDYLSEYEYHIRNRSPLGEDILQTANNITFTVKKNLKLRLNNTSQACYIYFVFIPNLYVERVCICIGMYRKDTSITLSEWNVNNIGRHVLWAASVGLIDQISRFPYV